MKKPKTSEVVEKVLKEHPDSRNSDKKLIALVLQELGFSFTALQIQIFKNLSFESVRRTRQKFQQDGKYMPTSEEVLKERRFKGMQVQQAIPSTSAEKTSDLLERENS